MSVKIIKADRSGICRSCKQERPLILCTFEPGARMQWTKLCRDCVNAVVQWAEDNNPILLSTQTAYREYGLQRKGAGVRLLAIDFDDENTGETE